MGAAEQSGGVSAAVDGELVFPPGTPHLVGVIVHILLEDVSYSDAPANVLAEQEIPTLTHRPGTDPPVRFHLTVPAPDPRASYAVRAHVDVDGDGRVSRGDYLSMQSYPVLTQGHPSSVSVEVRPVGA